MLLKQEGSSKVIGKSLVCTLFFMAKHFIFFNPLSMHNSLTTDNLSRIINVSV